MAPPACVNQVENRVEAMDGDLCGAQFVFPVAAWRDGGTVTRPLSSSARISAPLPSWTWKTTLAAICRESGMEAG